MSDLQYVRINASTSTAQPIYNSKGQRKAVISMQLPQNLVEVGDRVKAARMAVMKLQLPLAAVPACEMRVDSETMDGEIQLDGFVSVLPASYNDGVWAASDPNNKWFKTPANIDIKHLVVPVMEGWTASEEVSRGYHDFYNMGSFMQTISSALNSALSSARLSPEASPPWDHVYFDPQVRMHCKSDNTVAIGYTPGLLRMTGNAVLRFPVPWMQTDIYWNWGETSETNDPNPVIYTDDTGGVRSFPIGFYFVVSEGVMRKLNTLPWLKIKNESGTPHYLANWPDEYMYLLDTSAAIFELQQGRYGIGVNPVSSGGDDSEGGIGTNPYYALPGGAPHTASIYARSVSEFGFAFSDSDAVTISSVKCFVLTMSGGTFNQQVFPVNVAPGQIVSAQTSSVPILEVYYPLWGKPSDLTTDMVVTRNEFSDAAPTEISRYLLKERNLSFAMAYITDTGEMRDVLIPEDSAFTFQLCIEVKLAKVMVVF